MEPLGQSQVLCYLLRLAVTHDITLMSYEKKADWDDLKRRSSTAKNIARAGIRWVPLRYHKHPSALATALDVCWGCVVATFLTIRFRITIVHARSYVPSIPALVIKKLLGIKYIFDMRGFWADERVERAGLLKSSRIYRLAKWFERRFFLNADVVVSLTNVGVSAIRSFDYLKDVSTEFEVITTCTDLDTFRYEKNLSLGKNFILGYVGSAHGAYLFEPVLDCFNILLSLRPDARLLVITRSPHDDIRSLMKARNIPDEFVELKSVEHDQVVAEMARMNAGIFFVKPGFSLLASMPTKLGEFLACGIPCLGNGGIGDTQQILEDERVGVTVKGISQSELTTAVKKIIKLVEDDNTKMRCRYTAENYFSLEKGATAYSKIYTTL
jgi:glycosyltransferase involved in cell wall biosynthesis